MGCRGHYEVVLGAMPRLGCVADKAYKLYKDKGQLPCNTMAIWGYIYKISNLEEGKSYIGSTEYEPEERWRKHMSAPALKMRHLKGKMHTLQYQLLEYGSFEDKGALRDKEDFYMQKLDTVRNGYNTRYNSNIVKDWMEGRTAKHCAATH